MILLVFFGYKKLPGLGRSAGEGVKQLKGSAHEVVGDKLDPSTLGKSAGKGVRELREFKEAVTGTATQSPTSARKPQAASQPPPAPAREQAEQVDGEIVDPERTA